MLRTWETWNSTVRLSKFTSKKEIYEKFKEFFSKLVWKETLFLNNENYLKMYFVMNKDQYIFILSVNFENLTVRLYVFITSIILIKFQENQRSIVMSSNKCYNFKFL